MWYKSEQVESLVLLQNAEGSKPKQKFSTFFKSLVIELDKELYGPDNHLVEVIYAVKF